MTRVPRGRYVYAIVGGSGRAPRARGIGGRALVRVRVGRVAAIAEPMDRPLVPAFERLEAQERLVRRLAVQHTALLPARFGSHTRDERELQSFLRVRGASLARSLTRVRGAEQMILRLFFSDESASTSGTAYLRRLAASDVPSLRAIRAGLAPLRILRGERVERQQTGLAVYHLIRRGASRRYSNAVIEAVSRESGVAAIVSGPWPPYAFAPELLE